MTPKLQTLPPTTPVSDILAALERDGAVIIDSLVSPTLVDTLLSESAPFLQRTGFGRDTFAGNLTQRIGALIARTESAAEFAAHPLILDTMQSFLGPYCVRYQLHLTQLIAIHPGQGSQLLHRDRQVWGSYLKDLEPELNLMYACTEFTRANGCTRVVPGSHKWPWSREAKEEEIGYAEMRKGSVLIYSGSVIHSGGHNASDAVRIGLNLDYSVAWLRAEENQFLSCPPEYARKLKPEVQELLGYTMSDYTCNYFSFPDPAKAALLPRSFAKTGTFSDALPPEYILGRPPRSKPAVNSLAAPVPSNPLAEARIIEPEPGKEAKLVTLPPTATKSEILALLDRDGALIIRDLMSTHAVDSVLHETNPFLKLTATGHDKFSGLRTRRTGALVSRSKASWDFFLNQKVKEACEGVLLANCRKYQLHLTQLIAIGPGESAQTLHRDRNVWGSFLRPEIEPELNVIWALTPFSRANGATRVVPGSHKWDYGRVPKAEEIGYAEMSKGSCLVYTGSVIHGGGANSTQGETRIGMNVDHALGWLKQEENMYLSVPPEIARTLPPDLADLVGYTQADYVLGYFSMPDPFGTELAPNVLGSDTLPPEAALGRMPSRAKKEVKL